MTGNEELQTSEQTEMPTWSKKASWLIAGYLGVWVYLVVGVTIGLYLDEETLAHMSSGEGVGLAAVISFVGALFGLIIGDYTHREVQFNDEPPSASRVAVIGAMSLGRLFPIAGHAMGYIGGLATYGWWRLLFGGKVATK